MRPQRKRKAVKRDGFVDVDSDELLQMVDDEEEGEPSRNKVQSSRKRAKTARQTAAAAAAAAGGDDSDYEPDAGSDGPAAAPQQEAAPGPSDADAAADEDGNTDDEAASGSGSAASEDASEDGDASDDASDDDYNTAKPKRSKKQQKQQGQDKKAGKQQQQAKKPRKKRQSTARLCLTYAKAQFRLTDRDLLELTDIEYRDNPHYAYGPPMKLYLVRELEELARRKAERKAREAEDKEERAAARALEARARRAAAAAAAAQKAAAFDTHTPKEERHGSVLLPDTCLARVMTCLAVSIDLDGLRGPAAVAQDLAAASLVCWDFYHAAKAGFEALGEAATATYCCQDRAPYTIDRVLRGLRALPGPGGWEFWDQVLQQPMQLKLPQLKEAARQLELQVTGTKAELTLRLLGAFNLDGPTTAPSQLLRALVLERCSHCFDWGGPHSASTSTNISLVISRLCQASEPFAALYRDKARSAAGARAAMRSQGCVSLADFLNRADVAWRVHAERLQAEAAKRQELDERLARQREDAARRRQAGAAGAPGPRQHHHPVPPAHGIICRCGNPAAQACSRSCCGACCKVDGRAPGAAYCARHKTGAQ